jgi:hypothetical protein
MEIEIKNAYPILTYLLDGSLVYSVEHWNVIGFSQGGFFDVEVPFTGLKGDREKLIGLVWEKLVNL